MKRVFLHILFLFVAFSAFAGTDTWVVLKMKGGMTQAFLVPGQMKVKTEADTIRLTSSKMEVAYPKTMVKGYFFQKDNDMPTDIEEIQQKGISVKYLGEDCVEIDGISTNTAVKVYGINGIEYKNCCTSVGDAIVISLRSLPQGTYIIRVEGVGAIKVKTSL